MARLDGPPGRGRKERPATGWPAAREAQGHHAEALAIARELGTPAEEARALEGMGRSLLHRDPAEATTLLRQALAIYRKIGTPRVALVLDTLTGLDR